MSPMHAQHKASPRQLLPTQRLRLLRTGKRSRCSRDTSFAAATPPCVAAIQASLGQHLLVHVLHKLRQDKFLLVQPLHKLLTTNFPLCWGCASFSEPTSPCIAAAQAYLGRNLSVYALRKLRQASFCLCSRRTSFSPPTSPCVAAA